MVKLLEIILIGNTRAVISEIYDDGSVEVVYSDSGKHINEDAVLVDGKWEFKYKGVGGGYADKYPRLQDAIRALGR